MGIVPTPSICGAATANGPGFEHEVKPAVAVEPSDRMQEDSYKGSQESGERGMEEEDSAPVEELGANEMPSAGESSGSLSLFA